MGEGAGSGLELSRGCGIESRMGMAKECEMVKNGIASVRVRGGCRGG